MLKSLTIKNFTVFSKSESSIVTANMDGSQQQKLATRKLPEYFHPEDGLAWSPDGTLIACPAASSGANGPIVTRRTFHRK